MAHLSQDPVAGRQSARATTFNSPSQLTAAIPTSDLTTAANLSITVANPAPGTTSAASTFPVNNPPPAISGVSPTSTQAGSGQQPLTVNGSGFNGSSVVRVSLNGGTPSNRTTTLTVPTSGAPYLTATLLATDVQSIATLTITVSNPAPGGGVSNSRTVSVVNSPPPAPTNLSATAASSNEIDLSWNYSGPPVTGFKIFQNQGNGYQLLATVGSSVTSYQDLSVNSGNRYCYKVEAYNSSGNSADSNEACQYAQ
jgi:hypothetical protein